MKSVAHKLQPTMIIKDHPTESPHPVAVSTSVESAELKARFQRDGFVLLPGLANPETVERILEATKQMQNTLEPPIEFEAELGYPGAPPSENAPGGQTIRRFKRVLSRNPVFREWATSYILTAAIKELLGTSIVLSLAHHNCVMSKDPQFSSDTGWHQDIRFWRFERPELVSVLLALNGANSINGGLRFLPGSHRMTFNADQLDEESFLREDLEENQELVRNQAFLEMEAGDVAIFHCRIFHAASRNRGAEARKSVIFTYRSSDNPPIPGTRSDAEEISL
jgi:phytanoyl-CoA hydroxylase